jgi:teichuronic acid biosynthesis protein TuaE
MNTNIILYYNFEKITFYLVFFTGFFGVALFPVQLGFFTLFPYRFFLLSLVIIFFSKGLVNGKIVFHHKHIKTYIYILFFWLLYSIISIAWAASKGDAIRDITLLLMSFFLIFFSAYYFDKEKDFINLFNIWMFVLCVLIMIGFWENITGNHLILSKYYNETRIRFMYTPTTIFHNPNDFATYISLSIPFILSFCRHTKKIFIRLLNICCFLAAFYLLVSTGSRANIIAVFFEILFIFLFLLNINKKAKFLISLTMIIIIFSVIFPLESVYRFYYKIITELNSLFSQIELMEGSIGTRVNLIKNGLYFLYSTSGFGVGAGNAEYYMEHYSQYYTGGILNPHNWWLEILINYGILVFIAYILFYVGIIGNLWTVYRNNLIKVEKMICEALLISMVGFFFASMSSSSIFVFKPHWLLLAFSLSFINYFHRKKEIEEL